MSSDVVIAVSNLGKRYRIRHQAERQRYTALRDVIAEKAKGIFSKLKSGKQKAEIEGPRKIESRKQKVAAASEFPLSTFPLSALPASEDFWALRDVSFEVRAGEVVGIIGRNGAGKSTLLKILSRITEPTEGRVEIDGRVASLLEVGTGFHPELTGRENIFLNGAILGMTRAEIKRKFDEIVAFAEVEKFLDTPVKRYSSGMYVRLAFAVAAHLEPEILIVDEVLAVGDAEFQKKCLGKMGEVAKGGRTVLFVSHNMAAVQVLCGTAVYLQSGKVAGIGRVEALVNQYLGDSRRGEGEGFVGPVDFGDGLCLLRLDFDPNPVESGRSVRFALEFRARHPTRVAELTLLVYSAQGMRLAILDLRASGLPVSLQAGEAWQGNGEVKALPLVEGEYRIGLYVSTSAFSGNLLDLASVTVGARNSRDGHAPYSPVYRGLMELDFTADFEVAPHR